MPPKTFKCIQCGSCCLNLSDAFQTSVSDEDVAMWERAVGAMSFTLNSGDLMTCFKRVSRDLTPSITLMHPSLFTKGDAQLCHPGTKC
jgi:hypothetical protein